MDPGDRHIAETIDRLRADLAASQREAAALRAEAAARPHDLARLADEVKHCQDLIAAIMEGDFADGEGGHQDATFNTDYREGVEAIRYLAEIGRVEIVSEQGRRVVARWK